MEPLKSYLTKQGWKNDLEKTVDRHQGLINGTKITGAVTAAYLGATVAVNIAVSPLLLGFNGLERTLDFSRSEQTLTLEEKKVYRGHTTYVAAMIFSDETGEELEVIDRYDFLEGKILPGQIMRNMEVGKQYDVQLTDSWLGPNILSATERQN